MAASKRNIRRGGDYAGELGQYMANRVHLQPPPSSITTCRSAVDDAESSAAEQLASFYPRARVADPSAKTACLVVQQPLHSHAPVRVFDLLDWCQAPNFHALDGTPTQINLGWGKMETWYAATKVLNLSHLAQSTPQGLPSKSWTLVTNKGAARSHHRYPQYPKSLKSTQRAIRLERRGP